MMGPKEKKERALGEHLHLKAERCNSPKCAVTRKPYPPGAHGRNRRRALSDFGRQIQEKQKFKYTYGVDDRNLSRMFDTARKARGETSLALLNLLERRLDNIVFRLGLAASRSMARQFVTHGHIRVNGRRVRSAGYETRLNDTIELRPESRDNTAFKDLPEKLKEFDPPSWLLLEKDKLAGKVIGEPDTSVIPFEINLLVESFSK